MDFNNKCQCCGFKRSDFGICYKPGDEVFKIPLCNRCFSMFKINAGFLQTCMEFGPGADYSRFFEISDKKEAVSA